MIYPTMQIICDPKKSVKNVCFDTLQYSFGTILIYFQKRFMWRLSQFLSFSFESLLKIKLFFDHFQTPIRSESKIKL
jgi:hypothetical protein